MSRKLYQLSTPRLRLPLFMDGQGQVVTSAGDNIPLMRWPDRRWCHAANRYMLELYDRGLSRRDGGGTLLVYATQISHLIRFCHRRQLNFIELDDNTFSQFVSELIGEQRTHKPGQSARNATSVIAIGRTCLDFLSGVGRQAVDDLFIGESGRIRAELKEIEIRVEGARSQGRTIVRRYWHHRSFPATDTARARLPISSETIEQLRDAVLVASNSIYLRKRRYAMLKLLEITGGRRSEVAAVRVSDLRKAERMVPPLLRVITVKKKKPSHRFVPIARHDIAFLLEFADKNRRRLIRSTCGHDDDFLLSSETTGRGLTPNTITAEMLLLARHAGIQEQACAHMFRHRYITKLFVALIEQHNADNEDSFRQMLLCTETLKRKVIEWTGHSNIESLTPYIHLAFEEITGLTTSCELVLAKRSIDSFRASLRQLRCEQQAGEPVSSILARLIVLSDALSAELGSVNDSSARNGVS